MADPSLVTFLKGASGATDPVAETDRANLRLGSWEPLTAWRLQAVYGPVAGALRSLVESHVEGDADRIVNERRRILLVGGHAAVLTAFLRQGSNGKNGGALEFDVTDSRTVPDGRLPFSDHAWDCVAAVDWLPEIAPSQREHAVGELCRVAREGVVFVNAFDGAEVVEATRAINALHHATRGTDHHRLGRAIEFGLPDVDVVRRWLSRSFSTVVVRALSSIAVWQAAESLAVADQQIAVVPGANDISAATAYPTTVDARDGEAPYRTLLVASRRPLHVELDGRDAKSGHSEYTAATLHHALEAAEMRRAFQSLTRAVTDERTAEREEFRAAVASLAAEMQDLEARSDALAQGIRERSQTIANQQALLATGAQHATDLEAAIATQVAANHALEAQRVANLTELQGHYQFAIDTLKTEHAAAIGALKAEHATAVAAFNAAHGTQIARLEVQLAAIRPDADAHRDFARSRAGRLLRRYTRLKAVLFRRR